MKKLVLKTCILFCAFLSLHTTAQDSDFKLFQKSDRYSGFGALSFSMFQGKYLMTGGEGAAVFRNFYFGGFGQSGSIGNYTFPFSSIAYNLRKNSGGIMLGGISNGEEFFALYTDLKLSWDSYSANPIGISSGLGQIEYQGFSFVPSIGLAIRPITWLQVRFGGKYRYSGLIDDGGLDDVPYNGLGFNLSLTFGGF